MSLEAIPYTVSERRYHPWAQEPVAQIGARTNFIERTRSYSIVGRLRLNPNV